MALIMTALALAAAPGCGAAARHPAGARHPATSGPPPAPSPSAVPVSYPRAGSGAFTTAPGRGGVLGTAGTLLRFRVAVENDVRGLDAAGFAGHVERILGDPQGWTAGHAWRFQRVGPDESADFTIYLVTPSTRDRLCGDVPDGYTSCRNDDTVVLNVARWVHGVPYYQDLDAYRHYMVGHEVGHRLGYGHQLCPGPGKPAPVMQQQTLGLHGCVPNPWPSPNGALYTGPEGDYDQSSIPTDPPGFASG